MNLTFQQKMNITVGCWGAAATAFGALSTIMTSAEILIGGVVFGFVTACLGVVNTVLNTQTAQVNTVLDMPGVQKIDVNEKASPALAKIAVDPNVNKIGPTQAAEAKVSEIAKGT